MPLKFLLWALGPNDCRCNCCWAATSRKILSSAYSYDSVVATIRFWYVEVRIWVDGGPCLWSSVSSLLLYSFWSGSPPSVLECCKSKLKSYYRGVETDPWTELRVKGCCDYSDPDVFRLAISSFFFCFTPITCVFFSSSVWAICACKCIKYLLSLSSLYISASCSFS